VARLTHPLFARRLMRRASARRIAPILRQVLPFFGNGHQGGKY
jgi:hypothetical protein